MADVTKENFSELKDEIKANLRDCIFVAIDTEFTGIDNVGSKFKSKLFDSGEARYKKLSANLKKVTICQLGLALYKAVPHSNSYEVIPYNFYIRPHSCLSYDGSFEFQFSNMDFFTNIKFDFNKWMYSGISCLNEEEELKLKTSFENLIKGQEVHRLSYEVMDSVKEIEGWIFNASIGDIKSIDTRNITDKILLINLINQRFNKLSVQDNGNKVLVTMGEEDEKCSDEVMVENNEFSTKYIEQLLGVTSILRYISELQKPIVLHNSLIDLMLIYKQFFNSLPLSYKTFKTNLLQLFPIIYDTKFLVSSTNKKFNTVSEVRTALHFSNLSDLSHRLQSNVIVQHRPLVTFSDKLCKYNVNGAWFLHEAGFDAYLTGYCFLQLSHIYSSMNDSGSTTMYPRPMSPREHMHVFKSLANKIFIMRARINYIDLCGPDINASRPPWYLVSGKEEILTVPYITSVLSSFKGIDIEPYNPSSVYVTSLSRKRLIEVKTLLSGSSLKIECMQRYRSFPTVKFFTLSGSVLATGLSAWLIYGIWKRSKFA